MIICGPFYKLEQPTSTDLQPAAFRHFAAVNRAPSSGVPFWQIDEQTLLDFESRNLLEQLRA
jgi:hypothetical protein